MKLRAAATPAVGSAGRTLTELVDLGYPSGIGTVYTDEDGRCLVVIGSLVNSGCHPGRFELATPALNPKRFIVNPCLTFADPALLPSKLIPDIDASRTFLFSWYQAVMRQRSRQLRPHELIRF